MDAELEAHSQGEPERLLDFIRTQVDINQAVVERLDAIQGDVRGLKNDIGDIKGKYARYEVARDARLITFDLGVQYLHEIEKDELARWAQELSHQGVAVQTLRSFRNADLVIEASESGSVAEHCGRSIVHGRPEGYRPGDAECRYPAPTHWM